MNNTDRSALLIIVGPSASGKNTLCKSLCSWFDSQNIDYHNVVCDTTRPKRVGEKEGLEYNFISRETLFKRVKKKNYYSITCRNNWFYAFPKEELRNKICIYVCGTREMESLLKEKIDRDVLIVKIKCSSLIRLQRYFNREGKISFEMFRRFLSDIKDYFCFYFNPNNNKNELVIDTSIEDYPGEFYVRVVNFLVRRGILK